MAGVPLKGIVMDLESIKQLIKAVADGPILELTYRDGAASLHIRRGADGDRTPLVSDEAAFIAASRPPLPGAVPENPPAARTARTDATVPMSAALSGTLYLAPSPDAAPFVSLGDTVAAGQTLALVEAMKMLTEVTAATTGRIARICIEDGSAVEAGATLFEIAP